MAFRDEHEAALQRAASLEREKERVERELAETRRQRDELAEELEAARRGEPKVPPRNRSAEAAARGRAVGLAFLAIIGAPLVGPLLCHSGRPTSVPPIEVPSFEPPPPFPSALTCTIRSEPAGAEVVLIPATDPIGRTPLEMDHIDWVIAGGLELRLPGYQGATIRAPLPTSNCDQTIVLQPAP